MVKKVDAGYIVVANFPAVIPHRQIWRGGVFESAAEARGEFKSWEEEMYGPLFPKDERPKIIKVIRVRATE